MSRSSLEMDKVVFNRLLFVAESLGFKPHDQSWMRVAARLASDDGSSPVVSVTRLSRSAIDDVDARSISACLTHLYEPGAAKRVALRRCVFVKESDYREEFVHWIEQESTRDLAREVVGFTSGGAFRIDRSVPRRVRLVPCTAADLPARPWAWRFPLRHGGFADD